MLAEDLIKEYLTAINKTKVSDVADLRVWLQHRLKKNMPRKLFYSKGKGGGQTYKTLYEVFDVTTNSNKACYFYNENKKAITILENNNHISLQAWIDDPTSRLYKAYKR
jgi:hypothetical protein